MYSGSRGILYTAPPTGSETADNEIAETATEDTTADESATEPATGSADGLAADD